MKEALKNQIIQGIGLSVICLFFTALLLLLGKDISKAAMLIVCDVIFPLVTILLTIKYFSIKDE